MNHSVAGRMRVERDIGTVTEPRFEYCANVHYVPL